MRKIMQHRFLALLAMLMISLVSLASRSEEHTSELQSQ